MRKTAVTVNLYPRDGIQEARQKSYKSAYVYVSEGALYVTDMEMGLDGEQGTWQHIYAKGSWEWVSRAVDKEDQKETPCAEK